jgi:glycosyltransferase involved in cell wall biosynthesis
MKNGRLKVLVDATPLAEGTGGMVTYLDGLIEGWREIDAGLDLTLVGTRALAAALRARDGEGCRVIRFGSPSAPSRTALQQCLLPLLAHARRADLVFGAAHMCPLLPSRTPSVVTVHDLRYLRRPADLTPLRRLYRESMYRMSISRAAKVICDSRQTLADVVRVAPKAGKKASAIPLGADHARRWRANGSDGDYAIAFAHWEYKNPEISIRAWGELRKRLPSLSKRLVVIGAGAGYGRSLRLEAQRAGVGDLVDILPFVSNERLQSVFSGASLLVFPSAFEGYGLPVAEAMTLRIPVVCSTADALKEVGGDGVLYANATSPESVAEKCARVIEDSALRRQLVDDAFGRASMFTWARAAEATLNVFQEAVRGRRRTGHG